MGISINHRRHRRVFPQYDGYLIWDDWIQYSSKNQVSCIIQYWWNFKSGCSKVYPVHPWFNHSATFENFFCFQIGTYDKQPWERSVEQAVNEVCLEMIQTNDGATFLIFFISIITVECIYTHDFSSFNINMKCTSLVLISIIIQICWPLSVENPAYTPAHSSALWHSTVSGILEPFQK